MEEFANNSRRDIVIKCSAQSSKTQGILNCACWAIAEDPGPSLWVMAAKDEAREFVRDRAGPTFRACKPVAEKINVDETMEFSFSGIPFYFAGAGSPSKLQSKPIRWLYLDEVRNYPPGALDTVLKRTRSFWNARRLIISTPDMEKDALDRLFKLGDMRIFHIRCPACRTYQQLLFEQMKGARVVGDREKSCKFSEVEGARDAAGSWNFDRLAQWIRYECAACFHLIKDTPSERKRLAADGKFIAQNPNASSSTISFHWNAMLPYWVPWRDVVEEYINARAALKAGDRSPMKTFYNETLGLSWTDQLGIIEDFAFLDDRREDYDFEKDAWPEERARFIAADKQARGGEHYWYVIRAFGPQGKSRLLGYGRATSMLELEEVRKQYNVPIQRAIIDSGYNANEVYRFCAAYGWKPFKGDKADFFLHRDPVLKKSFRRCWDKGLTQPEGERIRKRKVRVMLYRWSNSWVKDLLTEYMTGLIGQWTIPKKVGRDYLRMLTAEHRQEFIDTRGRLEFKWVQKHDDNHYFDCELMLITAAVITKFAHATR